MKSIKKILPIAMMLVVLATSSISAHASSHFGGGDHYRPPGVRCYGSCIHPGYEDNGVFIIIGHRCSDDLCRQFRAL
ncbi:MAG: hypothetical protein FWC09_01710 [Lachnospiraceae bacterium]|nr:hypothetical protein [Lachnospiraceae bacterium]